MAVEKKIKLPAGVVSQRVDSYPIGNEAGAVQIVTNKDQFGSKTTRVIVLDRRDPNPVYQSERITGGRRARRRSLSAEKANVTEIINRHLESDEPFSLTGVDVQRVDSDAIYNGLGVVQVITNQSPSGDKTVQVAVYHGDDQDLIYSSETVGVGKGLKEKLKAKRIIEDLKRRGINEFKKSSTPNPDPKISISGEVVK